MPIEVKAYQCQWCRKVSRTMAGIINHEARCHANPEFNDCRNCVYAFLDAEAYIPHVITEYVDPHCDRHKRSIFNEFRGENAYLLDCDMQEQDYGPDIPIPYTCHHFKSKGHHGFVDYETWCEKYRDMCEEDPND